MSSLRLSSALAAILACQTVSGEDYELVAHLRQQNLSDLEKKFWKVADPDDEAYLKHMSISDISSLIGASDADVAEARKWLEGLGANPSSVRVSALRDMVTASISSEEAAVGELAASQAWTMISEKKPSSVEFVVRRDPRHPDAQAEADAPNPKSPQATDAYTISNIKKAYGIPTDLEATNSSTLQMVWGPGTFGYSKVQLAMHKASQCPKLNMGKVKFDTNNHGQAGGDNYGEGNLDVKMIASFGLNVETLVSNTNTSASTEEGYGFGQALLDFITELSSRKTVPQVLSMSLGSLSGASCDKLCSEAAKMGHTLKDCQDYIQNQRQVCMFLSQDQQKRINTAFQVLGLRGVSIFGSSGDGGSHFSFGRFQGGAIADTLNEISCKYQMPVFPTASPYVVSVGGEMWAGSLSKPTTWAGFGGGSGSGFSWEFDMPDHQKAAVAAYLKNTKDLPPSSSFNAQGRAYPDISAIAVDGTSQSCPIMAGIFSMIMDKRLNAGLPPLGFVAPRIWKLAQEHAKEVFEDIPSGNSKTSCDNGFPSVADSWDPNTGWGRPIWSGMVKHLASDGDLQAPASSTVVV